MYVMVLHSELISFCMISFCVTAPTSFNYCNASFLTNVLSFLCLHSKYIAKFVTGSDTIAVMNRKTFIIWLLEKKSLLVVSKSIVACFSFKSKISLLWAYLWIKSFRWMGAVSKLESNLETFKDISKVCLDMVLFFLIGKSRDSVRLGKCSKELIKVELTVKYMVNSELHTLTCS